MQKSSWIRILGIIIVAFCLGLFVATIINKSKTPISTRNNGDNIESLLSEDSTPLGNNAQYTGDGLTEEERINIDVYGKRNKSVVNITTEILAYNWFFEPVPQEGGVGSGSIIDSEKGYILTNNHVVTNANKLFVTLWDGTKMEAEIVGIDKENDLAVIKINPRGIVIESIPLAPSNNLRIGQKVLAIGNPFGLDRTLTTGIISGLGRPVRSSKNIVIQNMIQTDASINPGNSGGPLLNSMGELIGINTIIVSPSKGSVGVGFAVPADTVKRVIPELIQYGQVRRGWIDWVVQPLFPELVKYAKLPIQQGLLITRLAKKSNAAKAGLRGGEKSQAVQYGRTMIFLGGDVIVKINDKKISSISDYLESLESTSPGETVEITYYRGKKEKTAIIKLIERPQNFDIE